MDVLGRPQDLNHRTFSIATVLAAARPLWLRWRCWWQLRRDEREFAALQRAYRKAARRSDR